MSSLKLNLVLALLCLVLANPVTNLSFVYGFNRHRSDTYHTNVIFRIYTDQPYISVYFLCLEIRPCVQTII